MAVLTTRFSSTALIGKVTLTAVIPFENYGDFPNFNDHPYDLKKPMRTLYLLHGIACDEYEWLWYSQIAKFAEEHRIAVIMPYGKNNFYIDNDPVEQWSKFVGQELVEMTRGLFPLSHRREDTYIGGFSMGGYGAICNGLKYNETFSRIIALSSFLDLDTVINSTDDTPVETSKRSHFNRLFKGDVSKIPGSDMDPRQLYLDCKHPVKIYMACGLQDGLLPGNRDYRNFLQEHDADLHYVESPGAHDWDFWNPAIKDAIEWLDQ